MMESNLIDYYKTIIGLMDWGDHGINGFGDYKGIKICRHDDFGHEIHEIGEPGMYQEKFRYQPLTDLLFQIDNEV